MYWDVKSGNKMAVCREETLLFFVTTLLSSALGAPTLAVDATPSNYGSTETLKCTDATYSSGDSYVWRKDGVTIFTQAGEISPTGKYTGKYSEIIDGTTFKLVINNAVVNDEGAYTCNHAFVDSNTLNLQVESKGTATAKLSSSNLVEVTFNKIYPNTNSAVITCDSNTVAGSFVSSVADGDRFKSTWQSTNTFSTKPTSCSASVTLRTTFSAGITFTTAPPEEKYNCFVLGNGKVMDTEHECVGVSLVICCGSFSLITFCLGLAVGFILKKKGKKCCPWFYSDDWCEKCLEMCLRSCCLLWIFIIKLRQPFWSKVLCLSVIGIPFAFGIWVALKCSKLRQPDKPCITLQSDTTSISVHWEKPYNGGSQILSYRIICHRVTNNKEEILYTKETTYTIENLQPGTFYTVEVCACNIMGYSPPAKKDIQTKIDITLKEEGNDTNFGIETCNTPANMVESVTPGAACQGINERDTIVSINGESTEGKSYQEIKTLLTSPGDSITLTIEKGRNQTANGQKEMEELV